MMKGMHPFTDDPFFKDFADCKPFARADRMAKDMEKRFNKHPPSLKHNLNRRQTRDIDFGGFSGFERDSDDFDRHWNSMAKNLGFQGNKMEYGGMNYMSKPRGRSYAPNFRSDPFEDPIKGYVDEHRRGHFIPTYARG